MQFYFTLFSFFISLSIAAYRPETRTFSPFSFRTGLYRPKMNGTIAIEWHDEGREKWFKWSFLKWGGGHITNKASGKRHPLGMFNV